MTLDDLDKKLIEIRKRGLSKLLEYELIAKARGEYYQEKINAMENTISERFFKNVDFLARLHKSFPSATNIKDNMGYQVDHYYANCVNNSNLYSVKHAVIISQYYGIPVELLLFSDIELYGERIRKEYPSFFKQS